MRWKWWDDVKIELGIFIADKVDEYTAGHVEPQVKTDLRLFSEDEVIPFALELFSECDKANYNDDEITYLLLVPFTLLLIFYCSFLSISFFF